MDFLFINTQEVSALMGLPYIQQVTYLLGIRPYMDRKTFIVGLKRRISYQSLSEILYVEPHQGIQSGSPSRQQVRRIINGLERAGLVQIQSSDKSLILKCLLANSDNYVPNKADTNPTSHPDTKTCTKNFNISSSYENNAKKTDTGKTIKADIPHNSDLYFILLSEQFEKFWALYPEKQSKQHAWQVFTSIHPDPALVNNMLDAIAAQIKHREEKKSRGIWVPPWKYPANWLMQKSWEDELQTDKNEESNNANGRKHTRNESSKDLFWNTDESRGEDPKDNIILFRRNQSSKQTNQHDVF